MKKLFTLLFCTLLSSITHSQIIINELQADAGNFDDNGGEWIELKNIGSASVDLSCWKLTNGGSVIISIPQGLILNAGHYLLIGDASKMMCASCDFPSLNTQFNSNTSGFGLGIGAYSNTVFLNTNTCNCLTGNGSYNHGTLNGDRVVLFDASSNIVDAMIYAGGNKYGTAAIAVSVPATASCAASTETIPDVSDAIYVGREICNDVSGCNTSFARLPDGNNGTTVTWSQSGNAACSGCSAPCGTNTNTANNDRPTPGLSNSTTVFTATLNSNPVSNGSTLTVCGATPISFQYLINLHTNVALSANQANGNLGSYVRLNGGTPVNYSSASFNSSTGITSLTYTTIPGTGTNTYEFIWGDANTQCTVCPGSTSTSVPNNSNSADKECYEHMTITVIRETPLTGTPTVTCASPGTVTVNNVQGTNVQYILQKQSITGGPFVTVGGPQSLNVIGSVVDDDADPTLPNYQIVISSNNIVCSNPAPITVSVPIGCLGNPLCPSFITSGAGAATFLPASGTTVCGGTNFTFSTNINGVCSNGILDVKYDFDPSFNPYTQGTSLGFISTTVGSVPPTSTATGRVYISEYAADVYGNGFTNDGIQDMPSTCGLPAGADADGSSPNSGEYLELYNAGPGNVDLSGWMVTDGDWTARIPAGTILAANSWYLIGGGGTECITGVKPDLNVETCNCTSGPNNGGTGTDFMNLTNSAEYLMLLDCGSNMIDQVRWNSPTDATQPNGLAAGCNDYISATANFTFPVPTTIGGANNRARADDGTWSIAVNNQLVGVGFNGTPKGDNSPGGTSPWDGASVSFGTQCPPAPVSASLTLNIPDTCSQTSNTTVIVKAYYLPQPGGTCNQNNVIATATYTIPLCELISLSGGGTVCNPNTTPLQVTTTSSLLGNYDFYLSNGTDNDTIFNASGAGPFIANVTNSGSWYISGINVPLSNCAPRLEGTFANVNVIPLPAITNSPASVSICYQSSFDLTSLEPLLNTNPTATQFNWYETSSSITPINTLVAPLNDTAFYVAATTGAPNNCEGARISVPVLIDPLPQEPTIACDGTTVTITPASPNCEPIACSTIEYSADNLNWNTNLTYTSSDPGWSGWGASPTSILYARNANVINCETQFVFNNPCAVALPSTITYFDGKLNNNNTVQLNWIAENETNLIKYELERSDNNANYSNVSEHKAQNSVGKILYETIDSKPLPGINFYRLKMIDKNGSFNYSKSISILNGKEDNYVLVFPNPVQDNAMIRLYAVKSGKATLQALDMNGRIIKERTLTVERGLQNMPFSLQSVPSGQYILRVSLNNEIYHIPFSKK